MAVSKKKRHLRGMETLENRHLLAVTPIISEFMAKNDSTLADEDGDFSDWIELHNSTGSAVNLTGWHLTDDANDLSQWTFPQVTLAADEYLVVFASDKNRTDPSNNLHTNFKLSGSGEFLALVQPDGSVADLPYSPAFPEQATDISYGVTPDETQQVFFATPTPGAANTSNPVGFTGEVAFSVPHGYYDDSFLLHLSTDASDESIRYTLDGSAPTSTSGQLYSAPIMVSGTVVVRAAAFKTGFLTEDIATQSYIFVDDTINLTNEDATDKGFPSGYGFSGPTDYRLASEIIGPNAHGGVYAATVADDLVAVPTVSLVTDLDHLFGSNGILDNAENRGSEWERPISLEVIHPDGEDHGFQEDAGIRIQGGISRLISTKNSFRLIFKGEYGATKLEQSLYGEARSSSFDSIVLRGSQGEQLEQVHYIRDRYLRALQNASGGIASTGKFMHLYINGIYWGLYDTVERPDAEFTSNYFGGDKDDWDVLNAGDLNNEGVTAINGTDESWYDLLGLTRDVEQAPTQAEKTASFYQILGQNPDGTDDPTLEQLLDVDNFIDYMALNVFVRNSDWPHRNYYMARERGPDSEGYKFFTWDGEFTLDVGRTFSFDEMLSFGPAEVFNNLSSSEEYRVRVSDRLQRMFDPGGVLHGGTETAIYSQQANEAASPLVPETARWYFELSSLNRFTVNDDFLTLVQSNVNQFPTLVSHLRSSSIAGDWYRVAPSLSHESGTVSSGTQISLSGSGGSIYYTLDGTDPRLPGGGISPAAQLYSGPLSISGRAHIITRSLSNSKWSARAEGLYRAGAEIALPTNLKISEVHYHPHDALTQFGELDLGANQFEFVELANTGNLPVDLTGVQVQYGLNRGSLFQFGSQTIAAGASVVIPANRSAFISRYGNSATLATGVGSDPNGWVLAGSLSNSDELVSLSGLHGNLMSQFRYHDGGDWPGRADGNGSSLEVIDLDGDYSDPDNWRSSSEFGGSPGVAGAGADNRVVINEVLANSVAPNVDAIELFNTTGNAIDIGGWYLSDSSSDYLQYQIPGSQSLAAGEYFSLDRNAFGFGLSSDGEDVFLIEAGSDGKPTRFVDRVSFEATEENVTLGRWSDGDGRLFPMTSPTLGSTNAGPSLGPLLITEFYFHPDQTNEREWEFVEITNISGSAVDLIDYQLRGQMDYDFDQSQIVQPGDSIVVLGFHTDSMTGWTQAFRDTYSDATDAVLVGSFGDLMSNDYGNIRLSRLGAEEGGVRPEFLVDQIRYDANWTGTSGTGSSFQRVNQSVYGDFVSSWTVDAPNPGDFEVTTADPDFNGDGILDCADINSLSAAIANGSTDLSFDLNASGAIELGDLDEWLVMAGDTNLSGGNPYLRGDANLDGTVDNSDFAIWNTNRFTNANEWCLGNFNADGAVDVSDFNIWNVNKFQSASPVASSSTGASLPVASTGSADTADVVVDSVADSVADVVADSGEVVTQKGNDSVGHATEVSIVSTSDASNPVTHGTGSLPEAIPVHLPVAEEDEHSNTTGNAIDGGWNLNDKSNDYLQNQVLGSQSLATGEDFSLDRNTFGFGLSSFDEDVFVIEAGSDGEPTRSIDRVSSEATEDNVPLDRWSDGDGRLLPITSPTLGSTNAGPSLRPPLIMESYFPIDSMTGSTQAFLDAFSDTTDVKLVGSLDELMCSDHGSIQTPLLGTEEDGVRPELLVDQVRYDANWTGTRPSFQRVEQSVYGDFVPSGTDDAPNPGDFDVTTANPDFNGDGNLESADIDSLSAPIANGSTDLSFDLSTWNVNKLPSASPVAQLLKGVSLPVASARSAAAADAVADSGEVVTRKGIDSDGHATGVSIVLACYASYPGTDSAGFQSKAIHVHRPAAQAVRHSVFDSDLRDRLFAELGEADDRHDPYRSRNAVL